MSGALVNAFRGVTSTHFDASLPVGGANGKSPLANRAGGSSVTLLDPVELDQIFLTQS